MSSYVVVAAALLVFVVVVVAAIKNLGKGKLPPSPPSLPFVGHLHLVGELPHRSFLGEILAAHDDEKAEGEEEDFVDVLLRLRRQGAAAAGGLELAEDNVKAIIKDIMGAATDTSFVTLEWIMTELIRNTQVMSKLQNEIIQVTGSKPTVTEEDLTKLDYLKAVIKEVLRLHPPAPLLIPHHSTMPTTIQGYHIPAKTIAFINVWAIGRDPAAWDTPDEFRPERFMGSAVDFRGNDYKFIPFGAGRRLCPGIILALPGLEMVIASLLYHFDWELPDGMDVQDLDMAEAPGLTTPPMNPVWLIPRCRTI
ncbi:hypothetical protein OsJ_30099 [Oryza sativa Japonica Group]|uniref:Uncharacterized protein n=1 Tax=Oryza sativa subsp. japonica TaxID=39947 RepID=A3C0V9_ORYSJ|nr:hypothetical protein OsJ_30099 [Oryza sativa Japonica Group]